MSRWLTGNAVKYLWVSALVVLVDQASKHILNATLPLFRPVAVLPSLNLLLTYNTGISFSLLDQSGGWQRWLLATVGIVITGALMRWISILTGDRWLLAVAIAMVIGGAIGNILDRIIKGHVVDFIQVYYGDWSFAVFNVADAAISIGVALMLIDVLRGDPT